MIRYLVGSCSDIQLDSMSLFNTQQLIAREWLLANTALAERLGVPLLLRTFDGWVVGR